MLILLSLIALIILGYVVLKHTDYGDLLEFLSMALIVAASFIFIMALIFIPLERMSTHSNIEQYYIVKQTVENARLTDNIENAALQLKIIETNQWIINKQYWNGTVFNLWIPNEVDNLELLK